MDVMGRKFKPLLPGELEEWEGQMWQNHEEDLEDIEEDY